MMIATRSIFSVMLFVVAIFMGGCSSGPRVFQDNEGSTLTTTADQQLTEEMFYGKWDLDGQRTNEANNHSGITAIPSDVIKDVLGKGWRFEPAGVMKVDRTIGYDVGTWKIEGKNKLVVKYQVNKQVSYEAGFNNGYLQLKGADGRWNVMEKNKFFGL